MMGTLSREVQLELRCEHLEEIELPLPPSYQEAMSQTIFTIDDFCASRDTQNASTLSNENARDMQAATTDHEGQNSSLAVEVETSDHANRRTLETVKAVALIFIFLLSATFIYMGSKYLYVCPIMMPAIVLYLGAYGSLCVICKIVITEKLHNKMNNVIKCCCGFGGIMAFLCLLILEGASWGGSTHYSGESLKSVYEENNGTSNCPQTFIDFTKGITLSVSIACGVFFCFLCFLPCICKDD